MSKPRVILISFIFLFLLISGFAAYRLLSPPEEPKPAPTASKRQIINALPIPQRPFVALFPHETNKLITLFLDKPGDTPELTIDIEYLSGNALKGGRTTVSFPNTLPFTQAFLLGSCSAGGKCSFDRDITTGTIRTKLENDTEIHVLKSNYVFINGPSATTDQKLKFTPQNYSVNAILGYTHGFLGEFSGELASEPFAITSSSSRTITGTLTLSATDATALLYYDGQKYQPLETTIASRQLSATLNLKPWSKKVTIIRDDLRGESQDVTLYLIGPFLPVK